MTVNSLASDEFFIGYGAKHFWVLTIPSILRPMRLQPHIHRKRRSHLLKSIRQLSFCLCEPDVQGFGGGGGGVHSLACESLGTVVIGLNWINGIDCSSDSES